MSGTGSIFRTRLKSYLIKVAIWFVVLNVTAGLAKIVSADRVESFNRSVADNVVNWRPTQLARIYYGELLNGGIAPVKWAKRFPPLFVGAAVVNLPFAAVSTVKRYIVDGGTARAPIATAAGDWTRVEIPRSDSAAPAANAPPNPIIGVLGIAIGVLAVLVYYRYRGGRRREFWFALVFLSPLIGSVAMWVIGGAMILMSLLLGGILAAVKAVTVFAAGVPLLTTLMTAMFKPLESGVEEHVVASVADRIEA